MAGVPANEMPTEQEASAIIMLMDTLLSVGAKWETIRQELLRISCEPKAPFERVPSQKTLERMLLEHFECGTMAEYREKRKDSVKDSLKSRAVMMAMNGHATMMIFCLKNLCGWTDNIKVVTPDDKNGQIRLAYSKDDLP